MNFRRILANALARRIAYVLVAAVLAWLGSIGTARASGSNTPFPNEGAAFLQCQADLATVPGKGWTVSGPQCVKSPGQYSISCYALNQFNSPRPCDGTIATYAWNPNTSCSALPNYVGAPPYSTASGKPVAGSLSCMNGCVTQWHPNGDGTYTGNPGATSCTADWLQQNCADTETGYFWNAYAGLCQPPKERCEANQTQDAVTGVCQDACPAGMVMDSEGACLNEEAECPAGNVKAPSGECLPGDGQCAVGEARRPNGTCGKDSDGDGEADEDDDDPENDPDKETASGGDNCNAPPSCSGSAIACMQVKIQWRIDCNTRRNVNISGGSCSAMPVCTGEKCDAQEYAQLIQQWKAACALEKLAAGGSGGGDGDAVVDLLTGPGSVNSNAGGGDSLADGSPWGEEGEEFQPDESGYGYARGCPSPPSVTLPGGQTVQFDLTPLCNWVGLGGSLVLLLSGLLSLRIVAGGSA